ncbi:MAG: hypothetical protein ACI4GC_04080 [Acutalibacteraceae bacterium]
MKIAYRIITPILALGTIVMGVVLKLFQFIIGGASEELSSLTQLAQAFGIETNYEFSVYEIIQLLLNSSSNEGEVNIREIAAPIMPHLIAFIVFFVAALVLFLAIGIVAAATDKRNAVIGMSIGGIILLFVCIIISNLAFAKILNGEIPLSDVVSAFSDNVLFQLATVVVKIETARLSAGFYAVFGMYMLVIFWTILCNMIVKTPIQAKKKHRRKKPMKKLSAVFGR